MNFIENKKWGVVLRVLLMVALAIMIVQLFPREKKFKYYYEVGKPWNYELLTAAFDFPIYKTEEQFDKDMELLLKSYSPYFKEVKGLAEQQYRLWLKNWTTKQGKIPVYSDYVKQTMEQIYKQGIISAVDINTLKSENKRNISLILSDRRVKILPIKELYTPKSAYETLLNHSSSIAMTDELRMYNLDLYLVENLQYDSITSELVKAEKVKNLSQTSGLVQAGEKIVDKGEIVTSHIDTMLRSLRIEMNKKTSTFRESSYVLLGEIVLVLGLLILLMLYFRFFRAEIYENYNYLLLIMILILLIVGLTAIVLKLTQISIYVVPFAFLPIIVRVFFDSRTAFFTHTVTILLVSFMVPNPFLFIVLQFVAGMTAVTGLKDMTGRGQLTQTTLLIFISYTITYVAFSLISEGDINTIDFVPILYLAISSLLLLFVYVLIYILEKIFGLISSVTLVELTNINSDLMLKFAEVAPGSFQHSLQVSNLAAEAAKKINANSLLVRTGGLYHDIGKMKNPQYFIENQLDGVNPLLQMTHQEAAQAIIQHVIDGLTLAKKYKLPAQIMGFIATHHGRSQTKYFYNSYVNENPDKKVDIDKFTYPGPLPYSKETAILMMADAVEARSRTLGVYTEESIQAMVDDMIDLQIADGQLKNAPISFRDVETVKRVFVDKVKNIYHSRIEYPTLNSEK